MTITLADPGSNIGQLRITSLLSSKSGLIGSVLIVGVVLTAVFAPLISPADPLARDLSLKLLPPAWLEGGDPAFLLGTDAQGRDMLSRIIYGSRISLVVGVSAVLLSGGIGLALGLISGYFGGPVDAVISRVIDAMLAIPTLLIMLVIALVAGSGLVPLILVIAVTSWVSYTRVVRAEVLSIREREYVQAAIINGAGHSRILRRHILPNIMSSFVVISTLSVAGVILAESSLSFLGLGIQPPDISWGQMLSDGRQYLATSWWVATFPGVAISLTVLGVILLGDWLRDALDPRLR